VAKRSASDIDWTLAFDSGTCQWVKVGETGSVRQSEDRQQILNFLEQSGESTIKEICEVAEINYNRLLQTLKRMKDDGLIYSPKRGVYAVHDTEQQFVMNSVMNGNGNGEGNNEVHDTHDTHDTQPSIINSCHERHELNPTASHSGIVHDTGKQPVMNSVMNYRPRVKIERPATSPTEPSVEGYTHWNMGGVWYAATAQSPQTTVARGVETEQQAIAACRQHKAEMMRKYDAARQNGGG
jgi:DNA-binding transcriptional ArsR family regulator